MDWINVISNTDSVIHDIRIKNSCLIVRIKLWNEIFKEVKFLDYYSFKEKNSIGQEIGDVIIQTNSIMLDELKQDILNGGGMQNEIADAKSIVFYNSWNETIMLEVIAESVEFD